MSQCKPTPQRCATAPYNFVPLSDKVKNAVEKHDFSDLPSHDVYEEGKLSGYFEVELETKTPLYIRCPLKESDANEGKEAKDFPDFFYTEQAGKPVIPGSSLRGMLRNLVEIITWSKMGDVSKDPLIYRAVGDNSEIGFHYRQQILGANQDVDPRQKYEYPLQNLKGGYLKIRGKKWEIIPAKEYEGDSLIHVDYSNVPGNMNIRQGSQTVHTIYVNPAKRSLSTRTGHPVPLALNLALTSSNISSTPKEGYVKASLVVSGHMGGLHAKHMHCAIYEADEKAPYISVSDKLRKIFAEDQEMQRGIANRKLSDGSPCFYLLDGKNNLVFFGPTMLFRLPYYYSPRALLPQSHKSVDILRAAKFSENVPVEKFQKLVGAEYNIDLAEALFGYVGKQKDNKNLKQGDKAKAYRHRVSISDAELLSNQNNLWYSQSPVQPKILSEPKPTTFQHYLVQDTDDKKELNHYDSENAHLRGHKFYWHKPNGEAFIEILYFYKKDLNREKGIKVLKKIRSLGWENTNKQFPEGQISDKELIGLKGQDKKNRINEIKKANKEIEMQLISYICDILNRKINGKVIRDEVKDCLLAPNTRILLQHNSSDPQFVMLLNRYLLNDLFELKNSQHTLIKPLNSGVKFGFRVYFDNLSKVGLGALCWALQPRGDQNKKYCHKLGMGKPLGLGSVKLTPTLNLIDRKARYGSLLADGVSKVQAIDQYIQKFEDAFKAMDGHKGVFASHDRIKQLLKMLEFPGDKQEDKVYLDQHGEYPFAGQRDKIKIFSKRRVLPKPTDVESIKPTFQQGGHQSHRR